MKTLIIHPKDPSTEFLSIVYDPIPDKTVITGNISKYELHEMMKSYDRIMMMGHGSPFGLFSVGRFPNSYGYIIDSQSVEMLENKDNSVFIWCNADVFVNTHNLKGFYSGMFISEVGEATYCGIPGTDQELIDESNYGFCNILSKYINEDTQTIHENVVNEYSLIAETNPVAFYNSLRLYKK